MKRFISLFIAVCVLLSVVKTPPALALQSVPVIQQVKSGGSGTHVNPGAITVSFTSAPAQNDLIVIEYASSGCTGLTAPSGFTQLDAIGLGSTYYKVAGASETNSYAFSASNQCYMNYAAYDVSGENTTTPFDGHGMASSTGSSVTSPAESPSGTQPDLPLAYFTTGTSSTVTQNGSGWTVDMNTGCTTLCIYAVSSRAGTNSTSPVSDNITYSVSNTHAASTILINPAAPTPYQSLVTMVGVGGYNPGSYATPPPAGRTPAPQPTPTQGAYLSSTLANPSANYPPPNEYTACNGYCPAILSSWVSNTNGEDLNAYTVYNEPHAHLEGNWTKCHVVAAPNNSASCVMYGSLQYMDARGFAGPDYKAYTNYHEGNFQHTTDVLSVAPDNGVCHDVWEPDYFGSYGYRLYNATNDSIIATLGPTTNNYDETVTNGTAIYRYVDNIAVNVNVTSNVASGSNVTITPVLGSTSPDLEPGADSTTPAMTNIFIHNDLELCNNGVTPGWPTPPGCEQIDPVTIGTSTFVVRSVANAHSCSSAAPCTLYAEKAYSSTNSLDNLYSDDHTMHMANSTDQNEFGQRLTSVANQHGLTAPSCTASASPGTTVTAASVSFDHNPRPAMTYSTAYTITVYTTGAVTATVTAKVTGSTANSAPIFQYFRTSTPSLTAANTWTTVGTFSSGPSQTVSGQVHTWTASFSLGTPSGSILFPYFFRVCDNGNTVCTYPFVGQQKENERVDGDTQRIGNHSSMFAPSSPTLAGDLARIWDDQPALTVGSPSRNPTDEVRINDGGPWQYTGGPLSYVDTPYVMDDRKSPGYGIGEQIYANAVTGMSLFFEHENSENFQAQSHSIDQLTPQAALDEVNKGVKSNIYDSFGWSTGVFQWSNWTKFYNAMDLINIETYYGADVDINPVEENQNSGPGGNWAYQRYDNFALYLLDWSPYESFRGAPDMHPYPEYYIPIGYPTSTLPLDLVSAGCTTNPIGSTTCDLSASAGLWDASHQMLHRAYQKGDVWVCPPSGGVNQTACSAVTYGQTVYLLNVNTGNTTIDSGGTRSYTTYAAGTALPTLTAGRTQIVMFNPY